MYNTKLVLLHERGSLSRPIAEGADIWANSQAHEIFSVNVFFKSVYANKWISEQINATHERGILGWLISEDTNIRAVSQAHDRNFQPKIFVQTHSR